MVKVIAYDPSDKPKTTEPVLRLQARQYVHGVVIVAVDENGNRLNCGNILWITELGSLMRCDCVGKDIPIACEGSHIRLSSRDPSK